MVALYDYVAKSKYGLTALQVLFMRSGIGCHTGFGKVPGKAKICHNLAENILNLRMPKLRSCSVEDLEKIKGIGSKTARFFVLHSRPKQRVGVLDVHMLKYLRSLGIPAPKTTPPKGSKRYKDLEQAFLNHCDSLGKEPADFDLEIWNKFSLDGLTKRGIVEVERGTNGNSNP